MAIQYRFNTAKSARPLSFGNLAQHCAAKSFLTLSIEILPQKHSLSPSRLRCKIEFLKTDPPAPSHGLRPEEGTQARLVTILGGRASPMRPRHDTSPRAHICLHAAWRPPPLSRKIAPAIS